MSPYYDIIIGKYFCTMKFMENVNLSNDSLPNVFSPMSVRLLCLFA